MKIAHFSDFHLRELTRVSLARIATSKRLTGYLNLVLRRGEHHRMDVFAALLDDLAAQALDHVVITGDLTNLALTTEFEAVHALLRRVPCMAPDRVTMVPGNHDRYTRGSHTARRFEHHFAPYLQSDIPCESGNYPVVKLRGPVAIVGLATAVPRPVFIAAGQVGAEQLGALARVMACEALGGKTLIVLTHHPVVYETSTLGRLRNGLRDASVLFAALARAPRVLALHGHLHRRIAYRYSTMAGEFWSVGATSASLIHGSSAQIAGYNVYEFGESGDLLGLHARVYEAQRRAFAWQRLEVSLREARR